MSPYTPVEPILGRRVLKRRKKRVLQDDGSNYWDTPTWGITQANPVRIHFEPLDWELEKMGTSGINNLLANVKTQSALIWTNAVAYGASLTFVPITMAAPIFLPAFLTSAAAGLLATVGFGVSAHQNKLETQLRYWVNRTTLEHFNRWLLRHRGIQLKPEIQGGLHVEATNLINAEPGDGSPQRWQVEGSDGQRYELRRGGGPGQDHALHIIDDKGNDILEPNGWLQHQHGVDTTKKFAERHKPVERTGINMTTANTVSGSHMAPDATMGMHGQVIGTSIATVKPTKPSVLDRQALARITLVRKQLAALAKMEHPIEVQHALNRATKLLGDLAEMDIRLAALIPANQQAGAQSLLTALTVIEAEVGDIVARQEANALKDARVLAGYATQLRTAKGVPLTLPDNG